MLNTKQRIIETFLRAGSFSEPVQKEFYAWLSRNRNDRGVNETLKASFDSLAEDKSDFISPKERRFRLEKIERLGNNHDKISRSFGVIKAVAAAAVIAAALVTVGLILTKSKPASEKYILSSSSTGSGELTLPDGTRVWLNSNSSIEFSNSLLSGKTREVKLAGEAFFDVAKDDSHPFVVDMGAMNVKVLGTRFATRNSPLFEESQVTLQRGSVEILSDGRSPITLSPGQQCVLSNSTGAMFVRKVDVIDYCAWTMPSVVLDNQEFGRILTNLEHWYNVQITVAPEVDLSVRLTLTLKSDSLEDTLKTLKALTKCEYKTLDSNHIIIF